MTAIFLRTVGFFSLGGAWALTLPLVGTLYGAMTCDSALRHLAGKGRGVVVRRPRG